MPLGECIRRHTHREFLTWMAYFQMREKGDPRKLTVEERTAIAKAKWGRATGVVRRKRHGG